MFQKFSMLDYDVLIEPAEVFDVFVDILDDLTLDKGSFLALISRAGELWIFKPYCIIVCYYTYYTLLLWKKIIWSRITPIFWISTEVNESRCYISIMLRQYYMLHLLAEANWVQSIKWLFDLESLQFFDFLLIWLLWYVDYYN